MSSLFGSPNIPAPQQVPINPENDPAAIKAREDAARTAIAERKAGGRGSTDVGGRLLAQNEQQASGLLAKQRRDAAASELLG